jgi:hypothetical protein
MILFQHFDNFFKKQKIWQKNIKKYSSFEINCNITNSRIGVDKIIIGVFETTNLL